LKEHEDLSKVEGKEYMTDSDNKFFFEEVLSFFFPLTTTSLIQNPR